ncbi:hypothetical protein BDR06DRAFT_35810 [Suillus hirtellus]|nr:hypothetical protein BDR06DRAFT_35810 [Suillus hirtellus]
MTYMLWKWKIGHVCEGVSTLFPHLLPHTWPLKFRHISDTVTGRDKFKGQSLGGNGRLHAATQVEPPIFQSPILPDHSRSEFHSSTVLMLILLRSQNRVNLRDILGCNFLRFLGILKSLDLELTLRTSSTVSDKTTLSLQPALIVKIRWKTLLLAFLCWQLADFGFDHTVRVILAVLGCSAFQGSIK